MARRNRTDSGIMTNRKMNDDTYKLRRMVMAHVYTAKRILAEQGYAMPRIDVRIGDRHEASTLACARMGDNIIWVDAETTQQTDILEQVTLHEIVHAVRAQAHVKGCPLMDAVLQRGTPSETIRGLFVEYMTS